MSSNLDELINISKWCTCTKVKIKTLISSIHTLVHLEVAEENWYNRIWLGWTTVWIHNRVRDWAQRWVWVREIWGIRVLIIDGFSTCIQIVRNWVVIIFSYSLRITCCWFFLDGLSNLDEFINISKWCTSTKVKITTLVFSIYILVDLEEVVCNCNKRIWLDWSKGWIQDCVRGDWA